MRKILVIGMMMVTVIAVSAMAQDAAKEDAAKVDATKEVAAEAPATMKTLSWEKLAAVLPSEIKGLVAGDLDGRNFSYPDPSGNGAAIENAVAERRFSAKVEKGEKVISARIMDTGGNSAMIGPLKSKEEYDTEVGSLKHIEVAGHPGIFTLEKFGDLNTRILFSVFVNDRILVAIEGNEFCSADEVRKLLSAVDFEKLGEMLK